MKDLVNGKINRSNILGKYIMFIAGFKLFSDSKEKHKIQKKIHFKNKYKGRENRLEANNYIMFFW